MASIATPRLARPERRELVLRAGGAEFGRHGYAAARIEDIARAAGVTKPIVYRHFESKKGLYLALLRKHEVDLPTFVADAAGRVVDDSAGAILEIWLDYVRENSHAWLMLFRDHSGDDEIQAARAEVSVSARAVMAAFVAGRRPDLPPEQVEPMAELLTSGLAGLALWWIDRPGTPKEVVLAAATAMAEPALTQKKTDGATKDAAG
jgi:AcrR family transcriptional regulator